MSQGRTCLGARLVPKVWGRKYPIASGPEASKSLGTDVSRGRTWIVARSVFELLKHIQVYLALLEHLMYNDFATSLQLQLFFSFDRKITLSEKCFRLCPNAYPRKYM